MLSSGSQAVCMHWKVTSLLVCVLDKGSVGWSHVEHSHIHVINKCTFIVRLGSGRMYTYMVLRSFAPSLLPISVCVCLRGFHRAAPASKGLVISNKMLVMTLVRTWCWHAYLFFVGLYKGEWESRVSSSCGQTRDESKERVCKRLLVATIVSEAKAHSSFACEILLYFYSEVYQVSLESPFPEYYHWTR